MADLAHDPLGEFEPLRRLGGTELEIYLGADLARTQEFALIVDPRSIPAGELDGRIARCRGFRHRGIAKLARQFDHDGSHVLVFEGAAGASLVELQDHLDEPLALEAIWHIAAELASALDALHRPEEGPALVHQRLVPAHVVVSYDGRVQLIGLPFFCGPGTAVASLKGTEKFTAPEVLNGVPMTARANVYSLATMVSWLLPEATPVPDAIARALQAALTPDPRKRTIRAAELAVVFAAAAEGGEDELAAAVEAIGDRRLRASIMPVSGVVRRGLEASHAAAAYAPATDDSLPVLYRDDDPEDPTKVLRPPPPRKPRPSERTVRWLATAALTTAYVILFSMFVGSPSATAPSASVRSLPHFWEALPTVPPEEAPDHGEVEVRFPIADAHVFAFGRDVGKVNDKLRLPCKTHVLRAGNASGTRWYSGAHVAHVRCGETTTLTMAPLRSP